jgi:hypothetical protein
LTNRTAPCDSSMSARTEFCSAKFPIQAVYPGKSASEGPKRSNISCRPTHSRFYAFHTDLVFERYRKAWLDVGRAILCTNDMIIPWRGPMVLPVFTNCSSNHAARFKARSTNISVRQFVLTKHVKNVQDQLDYLNSLAVEQ